MTREKGKAKKKDHLVNFRQDVEEYHSIFGNTILTVSGRHSTALLRVFTRFCGEGLVQSVIARPPVREVSSLMPKCDLQSLFRLLSFPCIALTL